MKVVIYTGKIPSSTFIRRLESGLAKRNIQIILHGYKSRNVEKTNNIKVLGFKTKISKIKLSILYFFKLINRYEDLIKILSIVSLEKGLNNKFNKWVKYAPIVFEKPDVFHLQWVSNIDYWLALQRFDIKVICSLRGRLINSLPLYDHGLSNMYKELLPHVDGFHAVSKAIAKNTVALGAESRKIKVVYSGLNLDELDYNKPSKWPSNKEPIKILSIGHPGWKKAYHYSILAMKNLKNNNVNFHYEIVGGMSEELFYLRSDLSLIDNITFTQNLTFVDVQKKIADTDLFLLPSIEEGIANVVLESMALGTPVLASDCGGMNEVISNDKNGWLYHRYNIEEMARKIEHIKNKNLQQIQNTTFEARQTIINQHSVDQLAINMESLYKSVLNE